MCCRDAWLEEELPKILQLVMPGRGLFGGDVELHVIEGDVKGTRFLDFGGVVCEMFYRADLTVYG